MIYTSRPPFFIGCPVAAALRSASGSFFEIVTRIVLLHLLDGLLILRPVDDLLLLDHLFGAQPRAALTFQIQEHHRIKSLIKHSPFFGSELGEVGPEPEVLLLCELRVNGQNGLENILLLRCELLFPGKTG